MEPGTTLHEVRAGMSLYWVEVWPEAGPTGDDADGHGFRSYLGEVYGWAPGHRLSAVRAAKFLLEEWSAGQAWGRK